MWQALLGALGTAAAGMLAWLGVKATANAARHATDTTAHSTEQQQVLEAWKALVAPLSERVETLGRELAEERNARQELQRSSTARMQEQDRKLAAVTRDLDEWKRVARVLAKWGTTLRDQVLSLGGTVPATPEELLTLQALDPDNPHL